MASVRKSYHWKHGWVPISPEAKAFVAGKGPKPVSGKGGVRLIKAPRKSGFGPNPENNAAFANVMAMAHSVSGHDDPSVIERGDNPLLGGIAGQSYIPDFKGQSFKDWAALHGPILEKNTRIFNDLRDKKITWDQALEQGYGPNPVIFPDEKGPDLLNAIQENGGFTYNPKTGGLIEVGKAAGYAIAVPGTETIVGREQVNGEDVTREDLARGIAEVIKNNKTLFEQGAVLGGWYSPDRNEYMVEITQIFPPDRDLATQVGRERNQEAIFDLATGETVVTKGAEWNPGIARDRISQFDGDLTPEERASVKYYTGPGFKPLNASLRKGTSPTPSVAFYQKELDAALMKSETIKPMVVYRGLNTDPSWFPDHMAPGTIYSDAGYMSTAVAGGPPDNYKGNVMMAINVPVGAHALDLNGFDLSHHPEETELLLQRGAQLRVISDVAGADGQRMINLEVIGG